MMRQFSGLMDQVDYYLISHGDINVRDSPSRLLAELKAVPDRPTPEIISVAEQLAKESIIFSKDKIKSYARFLAINVRKARSTLQTEDGYGLFLFTLSPIAETVLFHNCRSSSARIGST